jgi:hypothetical protein
LGRRARVSPGGRGGELARTRRQACAPFLPPYVARTRPSRSTKAARAATLAAPLWRWLPGSAAALATLDGVVDSGRLGLDLARKADGCGRGESRGSRSPGRHRPLSLPVRVFRLVWFGGTHASRGLFAGASMSRPPCI